ncbi:MAG: HEAT repeat domain-containing protein [Cyanosarcina radialis HA8281-LM2]|jgi:hypothetical protein|nr:HEAT repeat domain-containing protein [Cyanosarcina radialis HA8281-LM2]
MADRLDVWGFTQAARLAFKLILESLAKEQVKNLTLDWFKDPLAEGFLREKDLGRVASGGVIKEFFGGSFDGDCYSLNLLTTAEHSEGISTRHLKPSETNELGTLERLAMENLGSSHSIIRLLGVDLYAFVNRACLKYFGAVELADEFENNPTISLEDLKNEVFGQHWQDESWHEVLRLIAGMVDVASTGEIIDYLIAIDGEAEKFSNLLLAAACLAEVKHRERITETANRLLDRLKDLTKYGDYERALRLADMEEYNSVVKIHAESVKAIATAWKDDPDTFAWLKQHAQNDENPAVRQSAIQQLASGWKSNLEILPWLKLRAQNDSDSSVRREVVRELVRGWKLDPSVLPWLKQRSQKNEDWVLRQAAIQELARGWKSEPDTLLTLKQFAQNDEDWAVRQVAIQELARGWKSDPDTLRAIERLAQTDEDWIVRQAAIKELARQWRSSPDILVILKQFLDKKEDWAVRQAAVRELATGWAQDPDTLPSLKQRAQKDEDWSVRQAAIQELAKNWKFDSDTLNIIKKSAQSDPNLGVRQAAIEELARGWAQDARVLSWFKQHAQVDSYGDVQIAAIQELTKNWKSDLGTLGIVQKLAQSNKYWDVRQAAIQELAKGWKSDPNTLSILKQRAQIDEDWDVRQTAIQEIAIRWKDTPGVFEFLCDRAIKDPFKIAKGLLGYMKQALINHVKSKGSSKGSKNIFDWVETNPRQTALEVIIEQYSDRHLPQILSLLSDRAANDPDEEVREFAEEKLEELKIQP